MSFKRAFLPFLLLILSQLPAHAEFNDEAWGARPLSLGSAYIGASDDSYAPIWNPAGMTQLRTSAASLTGVRPIVNRNQANSYQGSLTFVDASTGPLGRFGLFFIRQSYPEVRSEETFSLGFGRVLFKPGDQSTVSVGVNLKQMHVSLLSGNYKDRSAFSADIGVLIVPSPAVGIGAVIRNVNSPRLKLETDDILLSQLGVGISWWVSKRTRILVDEVIPQIDRRPEVRGGIEQWFFSRSLALRAGGNLRYATAGFGLQTDRLFSSPIQLQYAFAYPLNFSDNNRQHSVSFAVQFGGGRPNVPSVSKESKLPEPPQASTGSPSIPLLLEESGHEPGEKEDSFKQGMPPFAGGVTALKDKTALLLGAEDVIQISVKNHPELDSTLTIDPWGKVKLPFIGQLETKNLSPAQLEKTLEKIYAEFFLEAPKVEVTVKEYNSRVVYVLGAVKTPGKYPMKGSPLTVRDILYAAGLPNERAANWRIFVIREGTQGPTYKHVNAYKILYRGETDNNIQLETNDIVYVPMGIVDGIVSYIGRIVGPILGLTRTVAGAAVGF